MSKFVIMATWDDAPHLTTEMKEELWDSIPIHQRDARSKGIPQLGSGAIYPMAEEEFLVDDFQIPEFWPRAYALDVGWNKTAALWGAVDTENDIIYFYSEYGRGMAEPEVHARGINSRGDWIPGVIDPAARGRGQKDGKRLLDEYTDLGLNVTPADNAVEAGVFAVWQRLSTGRLKVFKSLQGFLGEYRIYRRDEKGKIVKDNDHFMDCMRYFVMSGLLLATTRPVRDTRMYQESGVSQYDPLKHFHTNVLQ